MLTNKSSDLFCVLGNDIRFRIVDYLASGEKCVCNIFKRLDLPQNLASHHLSILRENGLIADRKEGKWVYYSLNKKGLLSAKKLLEDILDK